MAEAWRDGDDWPSFGSEPSVRQTQKDRPEAGLRLLTNPWHLPGVFDSLGHVEATRP
jgi:hypothetical protein